MPTQPPRCVLICQHQSCQLQGASKVMEVFQKCNIEGVTIEASACLGQCNIGPTVRVMPDEIWYYRVKPEDVLLIVEQHLKQGEPVEDKLNPRIHARYQYY